MSEEKHEKVQMILPFEPSKDVGNSQYNNNNLL